MVIGLASGTSPGGIGGREEVQAPRKKQGKIKQRKNVSKLKCLMPGFILSTCDNRSKFSFEPGFLREFFPMRVREHYARQNLKAHAPGVYRPEPGGGAGISSEDEAAPPPGR